MKSLYIRFFNHKNDQIPVNSYAICGNTARPEIVQGCINAESSGVVGWMESHPNGKVDFIWA